MFEKKTLFLSLCLAALFLGGPLWADGSPALAPTLAPEEGDNAAMLQMKAALRLMSAYTAMGQGVKVCAAEEPGLTDAFAKYNGRNGNTLAFVLKHIKRAGGLDPRLREASETETRAKLEVFKAKGCRNFKDSLESGALDLYKSPAFAPDYELLKN